MLSRNPAKASILSTILGFLVLGGGSLGIYFAFRSISNLESDVQAAIFTFLGAFAIWLIRSTYEARRDEKRRGYEHRRDVYLELHTTLQGVFDQSRKPGRTAPDAQSVKKLRDVSARLFLEGSDSVYKAFRSVTQNAQAQAALTDDAQKAANVMQAVHSLGCFMVEMRKDIGFKKTTLNEHDCLRQLLSDYDKYAPLFEQLSCPE